MRKPAYNPLEIARSVVVAILEGSGLDLINCRCLPPLPDHRRPAVKRRGHNLKFLFQEHGSGVTDTRNRCPAGKFRQLCGQPEKSSRIGAPARKSEIAIHVTALWTRV